jgi:sulfur carrier protein ThiS
MIKLTLSSPLFNILPEDEKQKRCSSRAVLLNPGSWEQVIQEIQKRFPLLAERVLEDPTSIATSCLLAVNGEVVKSGYTSLHFQSGDEIAIIAAMAGG